MASYKDILEIANKRIDSGDIPDERVIFDIDSLGALTNDLAADSLLKRYPFDFPMKGTVKPGEIPLLSKILGFLELEDDPEGIVNSEGEEAGRKAQQKFIEDFPKKQGKWKKTIVDNPSLGKRGWNTIKDVWRTAVNDDMRRKIDEGRKSAIDGEGIERIGGMASKFFTPRRYEALVAGRDPSLKDYVGDLVETVQMSVPAARYAGAASKIIGKAPKVGQYIANKISNKTLSNILGNTAAPLLSEAMDAAMRGEDDPNTDRRDFSLGDVLMGAATNLGVNYGLAQRFGQGGRIGEGELSRSAVGGALSKVRKAIENFGKSRAERGLSAPTTSAGKILDVAEMAAPTLLVNRYGSDKDARLVEGLFGSVGLGGVAPSKPIESFREGEKKHFRQKRTEGEISKLIDSMPELDERDVRYLKVIGKNPDVVKFGFSEAPDDFKIWLLERGNDIIRNTEAYRPIWDIEPGKIQ